MVFHCDSTFAVYNTLISPKEQASHILERGYWGWIWANGYMVQENDSLEVNSDTHLTDSASFSNDDNAMDAHV